MLEVVSQLIPDAGLQTGMDDFQRQTSKKAGFKNAMN
jgi:hypothetical protein